MGWSGPLVANIPPRPAVATRDADGARPRPGPPGRLNLFQRTMLRWRELHPYSAAHAVQIRSPLDPPRLQSLITQRLATLGLTGLVLEPDRRSLRAGGVDAEPPELRVVPGGDDPRAAVWREFETQLNRPFPPSGPLCAFRFFAVPAGDAFYLGLVYDHFVAAGDAVALLLRGIGAAYSHPQAVARAGPLSRLASPSYWRLLLHHPLSVLWAMLRLPRFVMHARRAIRPPRQAARDPSNGLVELTLEAEDVAALRRAAAVWGVTLNDALLAGLLAALAPLKPQRAAGRRRRELAVASIVNIRHDLPPDTANTFGPFLAAFYVSHPVPEGTELEVLARSVHAESARVRRERLYLQTLAGLAVGGLMWPSLSPGQRERFFPKYHPVWGGVSMLNINVLWAQAGDGEAPPPDYLRAISTGPACPLVLAVTVVGDLLRIGISFQRDVFAAAAVTELSQALRDAVRGLRKEHA